MNDSQASTEAPEPAEIQGADVKLRRIVLAGLTLFGLLMSYLVLQLDAYFGRLQELAKTDLTAAAEKIHVLSTWFFVSLGAVTVLFAFYLIFLAFRVLKGQRFPPTGMRVINDTKILRGRAARAYGSFALILAVAVLAAGLLIPWKAQKKLDHLLAISLQPTPQTPADLGLE